MLLGRKRCMLGLSGRRDLREALCPDKLQAVHAGFMTAMTVFSAFSMPRLPSTKQPTVGPGVPQHKPFASQRKLQSFAFNPAIDGLGFSAPRPSPFVRPDVPPVAEDKRSRGQDRDMETTAEASFKARPQFRSALEQVCPHELVIYT